MTGVVMLDSTPLIQPLPEGFALTHENLRPLPLTPTPFEEAFGAVPVCRITNEKRRELLLSAKARNWQNITLNELKGETVVVCGGGYSLRRSLPVIRKLQAKGAYVIAPNRTHDWLCTKGIVPWAGALLDPMPFVKNYIKPRKGVRYFLGSQCHPDTLDVFDKPAIDKRVWHTLNSDVEWEVLTPEEQMVMTQSETSTIGLRLFHLAYQLGASAIHMAGFDSCYDKSQLEFDGEEPRLKPGGSLHAYAKPETLHSLLRIRSTDPLGREHTYYSNENMARQAQEFRKIPDHLNKAREKGWLRDFDIYIHGDGMIPDMAASIGWHFERARNLEYCEAA